MHHRSEVHHRSGKASSCLLSPLPLKATAANGLGWLLRMTPAAKPPPARAVVWFSLQVFLMQTPLWTPLGARSQSKVPHHRRCKQGPATKGTARPKHVLLHSLLDLYRDVRLAKVRCSLDVSLSLLFTVATEL